MEKEKYAFVSCLLVFLFVVNVSVLLLTGCGPVVPPITDSKPSKGYYQITHGENQRDTYNVVLIDGCEYLYEYAGGGAGLLTHKGNCTNHIHLYRTSELEK